MYAGDSVRTGKDALVRTTEDSRLPALHSFITLRRERFGALLFNPYMGHEQALDPVDAYAAELFTGSYTLRQVASALECTFGLVPAASLARVEVLTDRLRAAMALGWRRGVPAARVRLPDRPVFADDGPYLSVPKSVIWDLTYACNLRCPHCLTASGIAAGNELDTAGALALIDRLAEAKVLYLSLSGGEPLRRPDILTLLRHIAHTGMRIDIATNGVGIPDPVLEGLQRLPVFQVQVSIDGLGQEHDRFRGRAGAFAEVCRTVAALTAQEIVVSVSTTVTRENLDHLDGIIDLTLKLGCRAFKAIPFLPAGRGAANAQWLAVGPAGHLRLAQILARRQTELAGCMSISTESTFSFLLGAPKAIPARIEGAGDGQSSCESAVAGLSDGLMGCAAGHDTLSVGADGMVYPCPFLHNFPLGDLLAVPLAELWRTAPMLARLRGLSRHDLADPCRTCHYAATLCHGGCRAAAFFATGNVLGADPGCFRTLVGVQASNG
jgi:mycofactocin biosynthetic radical S-adenosylmethionine protein MftC